MLQINNETAHAMFYKLMERFDKIEKMLERQNKMKECLDGDTLLDNYDLSKLLGVPFVLTLQPVPAQRYTEIQAAAVKFDKKGREKDVDLYYLQMHTMVAGIKEPNFGEHALLKKFGAATPIELFAKLFKAGEISAISAKISALSGFSDDNEAVVDQVKN